MRYLIALCLSSLFVLTAQAERAWFLVPVKNGQVQIPMDSLTYTTTRTDTVWRDSTYMERHGLDSVPVKTIRTKVVTRQAGGFALGPMVQIDTLNALAFVFVYTRHAFMDRLVSDPKLLLLENPDTTGRTDSLTAGERTRIENFFIANGIRRAKVRNETWGVFGDIMRSSRKLLNVKKVDFDGVDITRRDQ